MCMHELNARFVRQYPINYNDLDKHIQAEYRKAHFNWDKSIHTYNMPLPCGYCLECVLSKAKQWAIKCSAEAKCHTNKCFVTLSYNDAHLPHTEEGLNSLKLKDLQDFFKRLLKKYPQCKIRRFWSAEYGYTGTRAPNGGNPHYHAVIFGWKPNDLRLYEYNKKGGYWRYTSKTLMKIWGNGFVVISDVTPESAGYTARYTLKKAGIKPEKKGKYPNPKFNPNYDRTDIHNKGVNKYNYIRCIKNYNGKPDLREPERTNSSRRPGIGKIYFNEYFDKLIEQEGFYVNTSKGVVKLPLAKSWLNAWKDIHKQYKPKLKGLSMTEYNSLMLAYRLDKPRREALLDKYYSYTYKLQKDYEQREQEELKLHPGMSLEELKQQKYETLKQRIQALKRDETFYQQIL